MKETPHLNPLQRSARSRPPGERRKTGCLPQTRASSSSGRTFDNRYGGRAHAEKILVGIFDFDTDRESLRYAYPVQFPFHVRHPGGRQIDLALWLNSPSNSLHFSVKA